MSVPKIPGRSLLPEPTPFDLLQQAQAIPVATPGRPAFRTPDAIVAGLGALLSGNQAGEFLGGFLGGKQQYAQQDAQYRNDQGERARQNLREQAQLLQSQNQFDARQRQADAQFSAEQANAEADRQNRIAIAKLNAEQRDVANLRTTEQKTAATKALYEWRKFTAEEKRNLSAQASADKNISTVLTTLPKLSEAARPKFIKGLRDAVNSDGSPRYPLLADLDDDAIKALGQSTASESAKRAQIAKFREEVGYIRAKTYDVRNLSEAKRKNLVAAAGRANAAAQASIARAGLDEAAASFIRTKASLYEPDLRQGWALSAAKIAQIENGEVADGSASLKLAQEAYSSQAKIASEQIDRILKSNGGKPPTPLVDDEDNPDYTAYQMAVQDQTEARKALRGLAKRAAIVTPVTQGRSGMLTPSTNRPITGAIGAGRINLPKLNLPPGWSQ